MINSKLKKNVLVIRGSGTLGDPLLLCGEGMRILSNNSDGDGEGTGTYAKYRGQVRGDWSPPLPSPLPSLFTIIIRETLTKLKVLWYYQFNYLGENMSGFNYNVRRLYIHKMLVDLHRQNLQTFESPIYYFLKKIVMIRFTTYEYNKEFQEEKIKKNHI